MCDDHQRHEHNSVAGIMDVGRGSCLVVENVGSRSMEAVGG
ncbi:hypothetical protein E1A91_A06G143300v1 [Gossypium mustelinum]|uniref:Uncharacterized protein n=1 Tax=Gossypium mustelinum TaxID=34275 RepID=A0A5D2YWG7_GOSMU|nr:hypothetical protein E1A91_A06G143300v1 [Gossypium mustelinum]